MKTWKNLALMAIIAILGLVGFIGCEDKDDGGTPDPLEGTWIAMNGEITVKFVAKNGSYTVVTNGVNANKGTYTVSGNTVSLMDTHAWLKGEGEETATWKEISSPAFVGTISGNTFTTQGLVFTKQ